MINIFITKIVVIIAQNFDKFFNKLHKKSKFREKFKIRFLKNLKIKSYVSMQKKLINYFHIAFMITKLISFQKQNHSTKNFMI